MWDWELLKNGSGDHTYEIITHYKDENFQYTHAISHGTPQDDYCLHSHSLYEVVFCIQGDVIYLAEGNRYSLEPGSLLILSPAVPHKLFICSEKPFERHTLYINYAGNASRLSAMMAQCQHPIGNQEIGSAYYEPADVSTLRADFEKISVTAGSENQTIKALTPVFAQAMLADLMIAIDGKKPTYFTHSLSKTTDRLMLYLSSNCTRPLTLQDIADTFSVSRDYCNRLFHKAVGMSVMQYVIYCRVLNAKQLLADGVPAAEAAVRSGFSDYSNFYRAYRKITGRTPSADYEIASTPPSNPLGNHSYGSTESDE